MNYAETMPEVRRALFEAPCDRLGTGVGRMPGVLVVAVLVVGCWLAGSVGRAVAAEDGFTPLFDGTSLAGWRASENPSTWKVVDGAIVCHGPRSHLFFVGPDPEHPATFRDFHLRAEVMTRPGSNSGVFLHTRFQEEGWPLHGYEVQVNNTQRDPVRTGSIYNVVKNFTPPARDDEWFLLDVVVKGKSVRV